MNQTHQRQSSQDQEAILLFNQIKDTYSQKIEGLNELKRLVFSTDQLDQQQRSKLRITIESLLIDLNEEIFSISEELAKSFTFERQRNLLQKAQEFEQRKNNILKKIRDTIDQNQSVKIIRRQAKIASMSPPQRDLNTFGLQTQESDRQQLKNSIKKQIPSPSVNLKRNLSAKKITTCTACNTNGGGVGPGYQSERTENTVSGGTQETFKNMKSRNSAAKKKKSPIPLRRKDDTTIQMEGRNYSNSSRKQGNTSMHSAKKQLFTQQEQKTKPRRNVKRLEEFEKFLAMKTGGTGTQTQYQSANKENRKPSAHAPVEADHSQFSTIQLQSEAFEAFTQEFAHMKNKMLQMQQRLANQEDKSKSLEETVDKLKTENLKLTTDVKIIRNEHSEILHSLFTIEKKNSQLTQENQILKRILAGERELKGMETNLPKPYQDPDQSMHSTQQNPGEGLLGQRKSSPFSSFLQKNRSLSNLRDSKDSSLGRRNDTVPGGNNTQKNFNLRGGGGPSTVVANNADFVSFQPSMNQLNDSSDRIGGDNRGSGISGGDQQIPSNYHNLRSSLKNQPSSFHHNPLLSLSNDRGAPSQTNNSFVQMQQQQQYQANPSSRLMSGHHSRRNGATSIGGPGGIDQTVYSRVNETPTTPNHIIITDETPKYHQQRNVSLLDDSANYLQQQQQQQRSFNFINNNKKLTPTQSSQQMFTTSNTNAGLGAAATGSDSQPQLSDWVLERLNKK